MRRYRVLRARLPCCPRMDHAFPLSAAIRLHERHAVDHRHERIAE
jgi:hypothetical protein